MTVARNIKEEVIKKFEIKKEQTDVYGKIHNDGLGFTIERSNGVILEYDGTTKLLKTI